MSRKLYQALASKVAARINCKPKAGEHDSVAQQHAVWYVQHAMDAERLVKEHMPRGSGFDHGTTLDWDASTAERLVFNTSFHHMDEHGSYDGWTEHTVIVTASLSHETNLRITGRNRNDIKDYMHETFSVCLNEQVDA